MEQLKDAHLVVHLPQDRDTNLSPFKGEPFAFRYTYLRSQDSRTYDDSGQDYLLFAHNRNTFAFCLCDGVSQSFYGDLAARFLGQNLLTWLWEAEPSSLDAGTCADSLSAYLERIKDDASRQVKDFALPGGIPPLFKEVLEEKRAMGSETTFVAGRLDLPDQHTPGGWVFFTWMGDSKIRAWLDEKETGGFMFHTFDTNQRWSTARGLVRGPLNCYSGKLRNEKGYAFDHLVVYSDGLSNFDEIEKPLADLALREIIVNAATSPTSDDISYLEVQFHKI
jgi:hypothetical protein